VEGIDRLDRIGFEPAPTPARDDLRNDHEDGALLATPEADWVEPRSGHGRFRAAEPTGAGESRTRDWAT